MTRTSNCSNGVTESKSDLVSVEVANMNQPDFSVSSWNRRTRLERMLIVVSTILLFLIIAVIAIAAIRDFTVEKKIDGRNICQTPFCIESANALLQNMNPEADPCEDFFDYACGKFEGKNFIPDDRTSVTQFSKIGDELDIRIRKLLEAESAVDESIVLKQSKNLYQACMNLDEIERVGTKPLLDTLKDVGSWPIINPEWDENDFDWQQTLFSFRRRGYASSQLMDFSMSADLQNSTQRILYLDQPSLGLSREYLIKGFDDERVQYYYDYMQKVAVFLGADPEQAKEEMKKVLEFEMKLAKVSLAKEDRRDIRKLYNKMTLKDVDGYMPGVNFTNYINNILTEEVIQVGEDEPVILLVPTYYTNLTEILKNEPKRTVANYLLWAIAKGTMSLMNKEAREIVFDYTKKITGKFTELPRWKKCLSSASIMSIALGHMYVKNHFDPASKSAVLDMIEHIKKSYKKILKEVPWMDVKTRKRALSKLKEIKEYIAYPEEILELKNLEEYYDGLSVGNGTFYQNDFNAALWSYKKAWKKLREKIDKTNWKSHSTVAVVNAFYNSIENSIQFPAGILQGSFYNAKRPKYMNYGGMGWVIGHELTHGFDDQGKQFDEKGNLQNWWEPEAEKQFLERSRCIIEQYGNYTSKTTNLNLNGINTQGENIADNGGIKEAYRAYLNWEAENGEEETLPGIDLTTRQLFWLSAANNWCSTYRPKSLARLITLDNHSPPEFRIIGSFSNSEDFANDFKCRVGTPMNNAHKCTVW